MLSSSAARSSLALPSFNGCAMLQPRARSFRPWGGRSGRPARATATANLCTSSALVAAACLPRPRPAVGSEVRPLRRVGRCQPPSHLGAALPPPVSPTACCLDTRASSSLTTSQPSSSLLSESHIGLAGTAGSLEAGSSVLPEEKRCFLQHVVELDASWPPGGAHGVFPTAAGAQPRFSRPAAVALVGELGTAGGETAAAVCAAASASKTEAPALMPLDSTKAVAALWSSPTWCAKRQASWAMQVPRRWKSHILVFMRLGTTRNSSRQ
mmetsp:Transcript_87715/g.283955  ORF Transcript_87715/g.283955 Transcript_87715/m.283955 type:complete len:268 (-) Transcript_87715:411-1214(-)